MTSSNRSIKLLKKLIRIDLTSCTKLQAVWLTWAISSSNSYNFSTKIDSCNRPCSKAIIRVAFCPCSRAITFRTWQSTPQQRNQRRRLFPQSSRRLDPKVTALSRGLLSAVDNLVAHRMIEEATAWASLRDSNKRGIGQAQFSKTLAAVQKLLKKGNVHQLWRFTEIDSIHAITKLSRQRPQMRRERSRPIWRLLTMTTRPRIMIFRWSNPDNSY